MELDAWSRHTLEDSSGSGPLQSDLILQGRLSPTKHRRMEYVKIALESKIKLHLACIFNHRRILLILGLIECWIFVVAVLRVTRLVDGVHLSHPEDLIDIAALVYPCHRPYFVSHPVLLPPTPIMWVLNGISRSTPEITFFFFLPFIYFWNSLLTFVQICLNFTVWPDWLPSCLSFPSDYQSGGPKEHK